MGARWASGVLGLLASASLAQPPPSAPLTTVAIDLTALPEQDWKQLDVLSLEKRLVLRLVQDGFAVVASGANPDVRVTATRTAAGLHLAAHSRSRDAEVDVPVGAEPTSELHLEVVQRAAELARNCAPPPPVVELPPPPPPPRRQLGISVGGALGVVVRRGSTGAVATDVAARLVTRYGKLFGAELTIGLVPSGTSAVTVFELPVLLGFSVRFELGLGFALEGALAAGVLVHTFIQPTGVGLSVDAMAAVPITLAFVPLPWLGLGLRVAPAYALGDHPHADWARGRFWFEGSGLAFVRF